MKNFSYVSLQKKYSGKVVALIEAEGKVVAAGKTAQELEKGVKL